MKKIAIACFVIAVLFCALIFDPASPVNSPIDRALSHNFVQRYWLDDNLNQAIIMFDDFPPTDANCHIAGEIIASVCSHGYTVRLAGDNRPSRVNPIDYEFARYLAGINENMLRETADE